MITLGIVALIVAFLLHIPLLWTLGFILVVVGIALAVLGRVGHPVAGRAHWY